MWHEFLFRSVWSLWGGVGAGVGWGGRGVRAGPGWGPGYGGVGTGVGWGGDRGRVRRGWGGSRVRAGPRWGPGYGGVGTGVGWGPGRVGGGVCWGGGRAGASHLCRSYPHQMSICIALSLQDNNANQLRTYCTINMDCHKLINQVFNHRINQAILGELPVSPMMWLRLGANIGSVPNTDICYYDTVKIPQPTQSISRTQS